MVKVSLKEEHSSILLEDTMAPNRDSMRLDDGDASREVGVRKDQRRPPRRHAKWQSLFNFTTAKHAPPLLLAITLSVVSGVIVPALAIFLGRIFNTFTDFGAGSINPHQLTSKISTDCLALVIVGGAGWIVNGGSFMFWLMFGELQAKSVRDGLFDTLSDKSAEWFDTQTRGVGALIPRLEAQTRELQIAASQPLGFLLQYIVTAISSLGVAFYYSWNVTLVTLAAVPLVALVLSVISSKMQPSIAKQKEALSEASKCTGNAISSIEVVKCFNGENHELWHYTTAINRAARSYLVQARTNALQMGLVRLLTLAMFVQGFWYGSTLVKPGGQTAGNILTTFWAALMATQAIEQILPQIIVLEKGKAASITLQSLIDESSDAGEKRTFRGNRKPEFCDGEIEMRDIEFSYPSRSDVRVLDNASFSFRPGEMTYIVGQSGSGKSTIGNLLARFYAPQKGFITLDQIPLDALDRRWLRQSIALVQQQTFLFNESLLRNVALGRKDEERLTFDDVRLACELASLQSTIDDLPMGLDTFVGAGGKSLSGGQRQRVAIARARIRNAPVLILDEVTSALDQKTRKSVMHAIKKWRAGKTTIVITHDVSQIDDDNFVHVMKDGRIVEQGQKRSLNIKTPRADTKLPIIDERVSLSGNGLGLDVLQNSTEETVALSPDDTRDSMDIDLPRRIRCAPTLKVAASKEADRPETPDPSVSSVSPVSPEAHYASPKFLQHSLKFPDTPISPAFSEYSPSSPSRDSMAFSPTRPLLPRGRSDLETIELARVKKGDCSRESKSRIAGRRQVNDPKSSFAAKVHCAWKMPFHIKEPVGGHYLLSLREILRTLWPRLHKRERLILILGFMFALVHAAATPTFSYIFARLLSTFYLRTGRSRAALKWSLSILGVAFGDAIAVYLMHSLLEFCGQAWVDSIRIDAFQRILNQGRPWFDDEQNGVSRLTECLDRNAEEMRNLIGRFAGLVFVAASMIVIAVIWSLCISWKLTLVGLASAPVMYMATRTFEYVSGKWESRSNTASEEAGAIFTEMFVNISVVRTLTQEAYFRKKYFRATEKTLRIGFNRAIKSGLFYGLSNSGIPFVSALVFYWGAILASNLENTTANLLTVFAMLIFSISNANSIVSYVPQINSSRDTASRLLRLARLPLVTSSEPFEVANQTMLRTPLPIHVRGLGFAYPNRLDAKVLDDVSLSLVAGNFTALAGPSGCGKSTLASILLGLYSATSPPESLTFAGVPYNKVHTRTLRNLISVVPQSPTLFPGSIAENISYGLHEDAYSFADIQAAASQAGIHGFITSLPEGYNTHIAGGQDPTSLSGGQAQRVAIARALIRRPHFLILDEVTSSLDADSAGAIRKCMRRLVDMHKMAVLAITHDKEMMNVADTLLVMDNGKVLGQ